MPEIAEVRRFVDQLSKEYGGQSLHDVEEIGGRFLKEKIPNLIFVYPLLNARFNAKGKFIYWTFTESDTIEESEVHFMITLGMSGSFGKQNKHSAVRFRFDSGDVFFNDIRHFGTVKVADSKYQLNKKLKELGWDCLKEPQIPVDFLNRLRKKNHKFISEVMMDQKMFAGLGNYLRSEILYNSQINPWRYIRDLTDTELTSICNSYIDIAKAAYEHGGATLATYSDLYGMAGSFYKQFKVYDQKIDPLGNNVLRSQGPDGRTIHWVPKVQVQ